jgi:biotin-dependent carboxylase-like uncharacterized protein
MRGFEVLNGGILTLLQDRGRFGFSHLGVTTSGSMDIYAYNWANKLLDNHPDTNTLELSFPKLQLRSNIDTTIAITGANFGLKINDIEFNPWCTIKIKPYDILEFTQQKNGQRCYLSVKGGFLVDKQLGSNATTLKENIGGIDNGTKIKTDDFLPCNEYKTHITKRVQKKYIPQYKDHLELRVILGYQSEKYSKNAKDVFFNSTYKVTSQSNRMACKLEGKTIPTTIDGVISEAICYGAIQIPKDGQPIILLNDRQTIGGYGKIGSVFNLDCYKLAQLKPNETISFKQLNIKEAQKELLSFYRFFNI